MVQTITDNPMKTFLNKYIFGKHDFEHIRHVKLINGTVRVFDGVDLIEVLITKTVKQGKRQWVPNF